MWHHRTSWWDRARRSLVQPHLQLHREILQSRFVRRDIHFPRDTSRDTVLRRKGIVCGRMLVKAISTNVKHMSDNNINLQTSSYLDMWHHNISSLGRPWASHPLLLPHKSNHYHSNQSTWNPYHTIHHFPQRNSWHSSLVHYSNQYHTIDLLDQPWL